ncbi:TetR-like C-terminal domain-containing protein [Paenibacillus cellulosilyticus]|nr:TetR-like C-terminal domain-containing protein [Paenibacillus cellulosilyticus]
MSSASKGAPSFHNKFIAFLIEEFKDEMDKVKNKGLSEDVIVKFAANAYVGVLVSWLKEGMPSSPDIMAKELGILLERIV